MQRPLFDSLLNIKSIDSIVLPENETELDTFLPLITFLLKYHALPCLSKIKVFVCGSRSQCKLLSINIRTYMTSDRSYVVSADVNYIMDVMAFLERLNETDLCTNDCDTTDEIDFDLMEVDMQVMSLICNMRKLQNKQATNIFTKV